ncbi:hypothetical protein FBU30_007363 [Linnemannia zychae]|nr:hypothetical protein FBU30_007363 [Linnemannia zychae]
MVKSIDIQESGPVEGIFGNQVEQRLTHHIDYENDDFTHARRPSEGGSSIAKGSIQCNTDLRANSSSCKLTAPSPRPPTGRKSWLRLPWNPWRHESTSMLQAHRILTSPHPRHTSSWWKPTRIYDRLPLGASPIRATGGGYRETLGYIQEYIVRLVAVLVSSKKRKGWFLGLILISLALTIFYGGYLMSQLQYHKDNVPSMSTDGQQGQGNHGSNIPITTDTEHDSGPRKDRDRSKAPHSPKKKKPTKPTTPTEGSRQHDTLRICNLDDISKGQWVFSQAKNTPYTTPASAIADQDLAWTGYGPLGCRSNIWNERYLLTPEFIPKNGLPVATSDPDLLQDLAYANHLQQYHWLTGLSKQGHMAQQDNKQGSQCRQPDLDLTDFVEVLKRSPLVMIGDKFLEQEFMIMECMLMGMQQQLLSEYRAEDNGNRGSQEELAGLDYWIDSEKPDVIELKVASGDRSTTKMGVSEGLAHKTRSTVYRKAKPGQMRLFDRRSNLTLITFIRSDVLWDAGMLMGKNSKHALKPIEELSVLDAGGLHPDCKLAGTVLMCEPAGIDRHNSESRGITQSIQQPKTKWWKWLLGSDEDSSDEQLGHNIVESADEEMSIGSDLDHDMINLEWIETLKDIVQESEALRQRRKWGAPEVERKPLVLVSNGQFWEYDSRDAIPVDLQSKQKLTKAEQSTVKESQNKRKSLLRQQYTIVLTNMLDYIKTKYPDLRVIVQTSVKRSPCEGGTISVENAAIWKLKDQEAALLNALTKTIVARMQDPLYSFLDTSYLRIFKDSTPNKRYCRNFMMPVSQLASWTAG